MEREPSPKANAVGNARSKMRRWIRTLRKFPIGQTQHDAWGIQMEARGGDDQAPIPFVPYLRAVSTRAFICLLSLSQLEIGDRNFLEEQFETAWNGHWYNEKVNQSLMC